LGYSTFLFGALDFKSTASSKNSAFPGLHLFQRSNFYPTIGYVIIVPKDGAGQVSFLLNHVLS